MTSLSHPKKNVIPMAAGLAWGNDGAIYQEKLDGEFATLELPLVGLLAGERLRGGEFICFDVLDWQGRDLTGLALNTRISFRNSLCRAAGISIVPEAQHGGEFLARVLARGGEGVVRKLPGDTYFTPMIACKRDHCGPGHGAGPRPPDVARGEMRPGAPGLPGQSGRNEPDADGENPGTPRVPGYPHRLALP